jgi:hypothetical protein
VAGRQACDAARPTATPPHHHPSATPQHRPSPARCPRPLPLPFPQPPPPNPRPSAELLLDQLVEELGDAALDAALAAVKQRLAEVGGGVRFGGERRGLSGLRNKEGEGAPQPVQAPAAARRLQTRPPLSPAGRRGRGPRRAALVPPARGGAAGAGQPAAGGGRGAWRLSSQQGALGWARERCMMRAAASGSPTPQCLAPPRSRRRRPRQTTPPLRRRWATPASRRRCPPSSTACCSASCASTRSRRPAATRVRGRGGARRALPRGPYSSVSWTRQEGPCRAANAVPRVLSSLLRPHRRRDCAAHRPRAVARR